MIYLVGYASVRAMKKLKFILGAVGVVLWMAAGGVMRLINAGGEVARAESGSGGWAELNELTEEDVWPEIYIRAVNPGYTVDGKSNVGEMIEIGRMSRADGTTDSDVMISLAGVTVRYTTSSGSKTDLVAFPENSFMAGENILLRLASSPDHELAALNYTKTLAYEGSLEIVREGEVIDAVCWTGKEGCYAKFKSGSGTSLVRRGLVEYELMADYAPVYDAESYVVMGMGGADEAGGEVASQCRGLMFSELLSYYAESQTEQFVEFYNAGSEQVLLDGCAVRYKNKVYPLTGLVKAEEYYAWYLTEFNVTKNPSNINTLELIDTTGEVVARLEYPNGQKKGTSWAWIGYDAVGEELWRTTYAVTPGEPNIYQEHRSCEVGKVINMATGNCVKVAEVTEKVCAEGQYLNPLTNRCKKIETETTTECKAGYERNPDTGRCRKVKENDGASYALTAEEYEENSAFVAVVAVVIVGGMGLGYVGYEFRHEFRKLGARVFRRFR